MPMLSLLFTHLHNTVVYLQQQYVKSSTGVATGMRQASGGAHIQSKECRADC